MRTDALHNGISRGRGRRLAFTLIELLVVIAIIGILAALVGPTLKGLGKGDVGLSASRQILDAVARARQLAISQRTTVYMVFVPTEFWEDDVYKLGNTSLIQADRVAATNLLERQQMSYTFVTLRSLGDQPGQVSPRYLAPWQSLPPGAMFASFKFLQTNFVYRLYTNAAQTLYVDIRTLKETHRVPFPRAETAPHPGSPAGPAYPGLRYIAFNYLGQLTSEALSPLPVAQDEYLAIAYGNVSPAMDAETKIPFFGAPFIDENPEGNSTNNFNLVHIDWLTGKARMVRQELE